MVFLEDLPLQTLIGSPFFNQIILPIIIVLIVGFAGVIIAVMKIRKPKPAKTRGSESNFCDNCGNTLKPTAKFCGKCGNQL